MTDAASQPERSSPSSSLMPIAVDVDLVRFEKNLLQIGFFGANDARDKNRTTRRVEQVVTRNGSKIKVAAEFRGSDALGLPSTTDRDKFIALLKIMSEERAKTGQISNPVRFSGYRLIQELGLSRNGEIYEEILRWGKRMTDTTITSEHVVYRAAKKVYSDETLHVFRSFRRTGSSNLSGTERQENYEVVLEDWLIENLNQRYVIPEDFNAYKQLTRPTAKGIFGNLHLWFHASAGKPVEKDYTDLCNLLNVQAYPHLSKIKSTMGLALNELVCIRYISRWDVQKMSSKQGYKVVLTPGDELLRILDSTRSDRRDKNLIESSSNADREPMQTPVESEAASLLEGYGVTSARALSLVADYGAASVVEVVEYLASTVFRSRRRKVDNPAGLIIHSLEQGMSVPQGFVPANKIRSTRVVSDQKAEDECLRQIQGLEYKQWLQEEQERVVEQRFSRTEIQSQLAAKMSELSASDERYRRMPSAARAEFAKVMLHKEMLIDVRLPSFDEWLKVSRKQASHKS